MEILVQKFGGTSVASEESREHVYKKIEDAVNCGYGLVVVVSAMGRNGDPYATDTLLNLIRKDYSSASKRELDIIFSCGENISGTIIAANLQKRGYKSVYLSGEQAGIITDDNYSDAQIIRVEIEKIMSLLNEGNIVVVGGGQGVSEKGDITTLGRGGSDTTGCALGVALDAFEIDIYTDVEGIMTADPRKVNNARLIDKISYVDCCNMAYKGAKVIHPRAVEIALRKPDTKLYVKSTFSDKIGTLICNDIDDSDENIVMKGVSGLENLVVGEVVSKDYKTFDKIMEIMKGSELYDYSIYYRDKEILLAYEENKSSIIEKYVNDKGFTINRCDKMSQVSLMGSNFSDFPEFCSEITKKFTDEGNNYKMYVVEDKYISFIVSDKNYIQTMKLLHEFVVEQMETVKC